jgi:sterol desaturase/sphingolipid hydroxylase (fatty acid hydroxylase superfamily)
LEKILSFFEQIPSLHRALILAGGITFFWLIEGIIPLFRFSYNKFKHGGINIFFTITTLVINFALAFMLVKASEWTAENNFGVVQWVGGPLWLQVILGLLLLDMVGAYFIHWLEHKVKWMWRFHLIHHSDPFIDTTSANRHHPGESVFRAVFTAIAIIICGAPFTVVILYQSLSAAFSQFNHANITVPDWLDRPLSWLIVSPNMHKVHHHYTQPLTDTNYGNIFSIWDRIFGTFAYVKDMKQIQFGIDTYPDPKENAHIGKLLTIPFEEYRPPPGAKFSEKK